jgi:hypothetical protein
LEYSKFKNGFWTILIETAPVPDSPPYSPAVYAKISSVEIGKLYSVTEFIVPNGLKNAISQEGHSVFSRWLENSNTNLREGFFIPKIGILIARLNPIGNTIEIFSFDKGSLCVYDDLVSIDGYITDDLGNLRFKLFSYNSEFIFQK